MAIHWFPGHMHKAIKEIKQNLLKVDVVIEVLDARLPFSSSNPVIEQMRGDKPSLKLLAKADLADPDLTLQWLTYFKAQSHVTAVSISTHIAGSMASIIPLIRQLVPHIEKKDRPINAMIMGIPNVGKSTIINHLADRKIAKTGNEPAVTKYQQRIKLAGLTLHDTPGILWPKIHNEPSTYRLATTGAIKDTAMEYEDVGFFAADYLLTAYPQRLIERYGLDSLPPNEVDFFDQAGIRRGCLSARGQVDLNRICKIFLTELRSGQLGQLTLETPSVIQKELIEVEKLLIQRDEKERLRKERRSKKKK